MAGRFSVEAVFKAVDQITSPIAKMQARMLAFTKSTEKGLKGLNDITSKFSSGVHKAGLAVGAAALAAGAGLAAAAKPGMEFEQQIADLGASFLKTRDQIVPLEKKAMELGAATKFSATEVAGAMEAMSKAGFDEQQTLNGIAGMTYAAAAAGEDLIATTETISAVMKGMQIDVSHSSEVADVLALASVKTASSISSLGESLSKAGPVAQQFGIDLKNTTAMVALLQDAGIDASEAGSSVATMLTKLATPTDAIRAKMRKLGVSFEDASGNMKSPAEVLEQLTKASAKSGGNMKQAAFFAELLGLRGQKAGILLQKSLASGKYDKLVTELKEAEGTAKKMADLRMNTLTGDLDVFTENVKGLGIELFGMSSGPLRDVVKGMTAWLDENKTKILQKIQDGVKWLVDNGPGIAEWAKRVGIVVGVFYAFATAVQVATAAVSLLTAALALNPIALIAIAIVAAIALVVAFWPEISAFFGKIWDGFAELIEPVLKFVKDVGTAVLGPFIAYWKAAFEFVVGAATIGVGLLLAVLEPIASWLYENVIEPVGSFFSAMWDGIVAAYSAAFGLLAEGFVAYYELFVATWSPVVGFFAGIWDAVASTFMSVLGPVLEKIQWAVDKVRSIGRGTLGTDDAPVAEDGQPAPQVVSPQARVAQSISESTTTNYSELTIKDETKRANFTKKPAAKHSTIRLQPTGAP